MLQEYLLKSWHLACIMYGFHANDTAHRERNIWSLLLFSDGGAVVLRMDWEAIYSIEDLLLFFMLVTVLCTSEVYSLQMYLFDIDGQVVIVACKTFSFPITAPFSTWSHKNPYRCALSVRHYRLCTSQHVSPQFQREMSTEWH